MLVSAQGGLRNRVPLRYGGRDGSGNGAAPDGGRFGSGWVRILLGEDEGLIALDLESVLTDLGYEVVGPVASVEEVLAASSDCDGARLDVTLRDGRVCPAARALLARGVPVIFSSGYDEAGQFPAEFRDVPRLMKPYDNRALRELCTLTFAARSCSAT